MLIAAHFWIYELPGSDVCQIILAEYLFSQILVVGKDGSSAAINIC